MCGDCSARIAWARASSGNALSAGTRSTRVGEGGAGRLAPQVEIVKDST